MITVKLLGFFPLAATAIWLRAAAAPVPGHQVTVRLTAFTNQSVVVHVGATPVGLQLASDTTQHFVDSRTVQTPVDLRVSAIADTLRFTTEGNLPIRISFMDGASAAERALTPWGHRIKLARVNGDWRPEAEVIPAQPTRTVFTDSALHAEQCQPLPSGADWRRMCTPRDQGISYRKLPPR
jgi:hypothetical protein